MKVSIFGTGYVGLVTGACFAEMGNDVLCLDIDEKKVNYLKTGVVPIFEPGLAALIKQNFSKRTLKFSSCAPSKTPKSPPAVAVKIMSAPEAFIEHLRNYQKQNYYEGNNDGNTDIEGTTGMQSPNKRRNYYLNPQDLYLLLISPNEIEK